MDEWTDKGTDGPMNGSVNGPMNMDEWTNEWTNEYGRMDQMNGPMNMDEWTESERQTLPPVVRRRLPERDRVGGARHPLLGGGVHPFREGRAHAQHREDKENPRADGRGVSSHAPKLSLNSRTVSKAPLTTNELTV